MVKKYSAFMGKTLFSLRVRHVTRSCAFVLGVVLVMCGKTSMAAAPHFANAIKDTTVCWSSSSTTVTIDLHDLLAFSDADPGQTETFTVFSGPSSTSSLPYGNGNLGGFSAGTNTALSTDMHPAANALTYTSPTNNYGLVSFTIKIDDGTASDTMRINVRMVLPAAPHITSNYTGVHVGSSISLTGGMSTDSSRTGSNLATAWLAAPGSHLNVSGSGVVTGTSIGYDTVLYRITNECGARYDSFPVVVLNNIPPIVTSVISTAPIPGDTVTLTGSFNATPDQNIVFFGATRATVVSTSTATMLKVVVPAGATFSSITVLDSFSQLATYVSPATIPHYNNSNFVTGSLDSVYNTSPTILSLPTIHPLSGPYSVEYVDLDGDGRGDLVCSGTSVDAVVVFQNISAYGRVDNTSFATYQAFTVAAAPLSVKVGDFNGDGKPDLATADAGAAQVTILRNISTPGTISFANRYDIALPGALPSELAIGDFNNDGRPDIAVAMTGANDTGSYTGTGFVPTTAQKLGRLVVIQNNFNRAVTYPGTYFSSGDFTVMNAFVYDSVTSPISVAAGDLNGDGVADIAISLHHKRQVEVFKSTSTTGGNITFAPAIQLSTAAGGPGPLAAGAGPGYNYALYKTGYPEQVRIGDLDNDGRPDIAVAVTDSDLLAGNSWNYVYIFPNSTPGTSTPLSFSSSVNVPTRGAATVALALGDITGDGKLDIVASNPGGHSIAVIGHSATLAGFAYDTALLRTNGLAAFVSPAIGDVDGNGINDIVVANRPGHQLDLWRSYPKPDTVSITGDSVICLQTAPGQVTGTLHNYHTPRATNTWSIPNPHNHVNLVGAVNDTVVSLTGISAGSDTIINTIVLLGDTNVVKYAVRTLNVISSGVISGKDSVCQGGFDTLSSTVPGGHWYTTSPSNISIDSVTGIATGVASSGSTIISYHVGSCPTPPPTFNVRIAIMPQAGVINGTTTTLCPSASTTLHLASLFTRGGVWSSRHGNLTFSPSVTGDTVTVTALSSVTSGTAADSVVYAVGNVCDTAKSYYVISFGSGITQPVIASGPNDSVCSGSNINLTISTGVDPSGVWASNRPAVASVSSSTTSGATIQAVATTADTTVIRYTVNNGCGIAVAYDTITVAPQISTVTLTGSHQVCIGQNITLTPPATVAGVAYSWAVSNTSYATVNSSGVVSGIAAGVDTVKYIQTNVCGVIPSPFIDTVDQSASTGSITGNTLMCQGQTQSISNATALSGTSFAYINWTSSLPSVATVTSSGATTATVGGASASASPSIITSNIHACNTVTPATLSVQVDAAPAPGAISGSTHLCVSGSSVVLSNTTAGTGTFAWRTTPGLTISSPTATSVTITANATSSQRYDTTWYVLTTGCGADSVYHADTTYLQPVAGTIVGIATADTICAGANITFTNTTANPAGTNPWSSASSSIASIDPATGVITGGTVTTLSSTTITYTTSNVCNTVTATRPIVVRNLPNSGGPGTITGSASYVCSGNSMVLTAAGEPNGTWRTIPTANATITVNSTSGVTSNITGNATTAAGAEPHHTADIHYVVTNVCGSDSTSYTVNINTAPHVTAITPVPGPGGAVYDSVCLSTATVHTTINETASPTSSTSPGFTFAWTDPTPALLTITGSATVTISGNVAGLDTIKFKAANACGSDSATRVIKVLPMPSAGFIVAPDVICLSGGDVQLYDTLATGDTVVLGTWDVPSGSGSLYVDPSSGLASPLSFGTATVVFQIAPGYCGTASTSKNVLVDIGADAGVISGDTSFCVNQTSLLVDNPAFGDYWFSGDTSIAKVDSVTGLVFGVSAGIATIYYVDTSACGNATASQNVHVNGLSPVGYITGQDTSCIGGTMTLSDPDPLAAGGRWTSSNPAVASVDTATGVVTALSAGGATITYTTINGCGPNDTTYKVRVFAAPNFTSATTANVCDSAEFLYTATSDTAATTWSWSRAVAIDIVNAAATGATATIDEYLDNSGNAVANAVYVYTMTAHGCISNQNVTVSVAPTPHLISPTSDTICSGQLFVYNDIESTGPTTNANWTRPAVTNIQNPTQSGAHAISEALVNMTNNTAIPVVYHYSLSWGTCPSHIEDLTVLVDPSAGSPKITTHSPSAVCARTLDQNFGAETTPPAGVTYSWWATGAQVWATGSTQQYSLVNFTEPGDAVVYLLASASGFNCPAKDSFKVTVGTSVSDLPEVSYFNGDFVCLANDQDTYQWGYDSRSTLDSALFESETNQNFYVPTPDFTNKYYFVITTHNGCMQKSYFIVPTGVQNVTASMGEMKLYPNPADRYVNVEINNTSGGKYNIEVVDLLGQKLNTKDLVNNKTTVDVADLAAGVYFINCYRDGVKFASAKFIKN